MIGERSQCQRERWSPKGGEMRSVSILAVPRRGVDTRLCASKDAGPQRGVNSEGIPHRLEKEASVNEDVGPGRGVECDVPHWLGRRTKYPL